MSTPPPVSPPTKSWRQRAATPNPYAAAGQTPTAQPPPPGPSPAAKRREDAAYRPVGQPTDLIVTGEAVALELRPAMLLSRAGSAAIDVAVSLLCGFAIWEFASTLTSNFAQLGVVRVTSFATAMVIIPTTVETLTRGLSAGRLAAGIRIVRDDGGPVRFRQAFVRALTGVLEVWLTLGVLATLTSLSHPRGKRLGDLLAGTYAVRIRGSETSLAPLLMPPDLATWAETADIRRLPSSVALHARIFLDRTGSLALQARESNARTLASAIEPYVAPPPPWGTHPERFLAAVLVTRRDREYASASRRQESEREEAERMRHLRYGVADHQ